MLDGAARVDDLFARCQRLGMKSIAMTDHGNVYGAYEFWSTARKLGINPIIGMEGYLAPGSRHERTRATLGGAVLDDSNPGEMYTHMTLLAANNTGLHNLCAISSRAYTEGYYYKPRADRELLAEHAAGIIATTGCPSGEVARLLQRGRFEDACQAAADYRDIFEPGNFYVEVMDHGLEIERRTLPDLLRLAALLDLPIVATNDSHYVEPGDAGAHAALLCVQTGKTMDDPKRFQFGGTGYYLKSAEEMRKLWDGEVPGACDNTLRIAERVHVEFDTSRDLMPRFPVPAGETEASWLIKEVDRGLARRWPGGLPGGHRARADYELSLIVPRGYGGYFLITADMVSWAKAQGIRVGPGRGSAVGSLVAYALGITAVDPIRHKLLFERMLNPERPSLPDIDLDFDDRRRGEVIEYLGKRYGRDRVAQIVTYSQILTRSAIKDTAKVLYGPRGFAMADRIIDAMPPPVIAKDITLTEMFNPESKRWPEAARVRMLYVADPEVQRILDTAKGLENLKRQWGVHASGVILCGPPLIEAGVPIQWRPKDGALITQFDMRVCEELGLLKLDILGLRNLTVIADTLAALTRDGQVAPDLDTLPLDDAETYRLLARGDTLGVFQLDSGPLRDLLKRMEPDRFEDIVAVLALYRPGPMAANAHNDYADRKTGRQAVKPIHPELAEPLAEILGDTWGLIVYQEQVMALAQRVAGYTLGGADLLRKAMGKKIRAVLDKEEVVFADGMRKNGYSDDAIKTLWDILIPFCQYAFGRAHSAAYGMLAYWTAYLKAHHPTEYMAALLTSTADNKDRLAIYLHECRKMGIRVLPPDAHRSEHGFTAVSGDILFGLDAIRNVGAPVVSSIITARAGKAAPRNLTEFLRETSVEALSARVIASLIEAGALDFLGHNRAGMFAAHKDAVVSARARKKKEATGQLDLFGELIETGADPFEIAVPTTVWDTGYQLKREREMIGLYVSGHPLDGAERALARQSDTQIVSILDGTVAGDVTVILGGVLTEVTRKASRATGAEWATARLEDRTGEIELLVFAKSYATIGRGNITLDDIVLIKGRVSRKDDRVTVIVNGLVRPDLTELSGESDARPSTTVTVPAGVCTPERLARIRLVLASHPGEHAVRLVVTGRAHRHELTLTDQFVTPGRALSTELAPLLTAG